MARLSIVIPVFNNLNYTKSCIKDLADLPWDHEIYIVDDGSTDGTKKYLLDLYANWKGKAKFGFSRREQPLGFAHSCNLGFSSTNSEYVMFLNNDIKVRSDYDSWTQNIIEAAETGALVGPTIGILDEHLNFVCEAKKMPQKGHVYMSGWNITASRATWKSLVKTAGNNSIGPFSTEFGRAYFEDTDLGFRAKQQEIPFKIVSAPVQHIGKCTTKKLNLSQLYSEAKQIFLNKWKDKL